MGSANHGNRNPVVEEVVHGLQGAEMSADRKGFSVIPAAVYTERFVALTPAHVSKQVFGASAFQIEQRRRRAGLYRNPGRSYLHGGLTG